MTTNTYLDIRRDRDNNKKKLAQSFRGPKRANTNKYMFQNVCQQKAQSRGVNVFQYYFGYSLRLVLDYIKFVDEMGCCRTHPKKINKNKMKAPKFMLSL